MEQLIETEEADGKTDPEAQKEIKFINESSDYFDIEMMEEDDLVSDEQVLEDIKNNPDKAEYAIPDMFQTFASLPYGYSFEFVNFQSTSSFSPTAYRNVYNRIYNQTSSTVAVVMYREYSSGSPEYIGTRYYLGNSTSTASFSGLVIGANCYFKLTGNGDTTSTKRGSGSVWQGL